LCFASTRRNSAVTDKHGNVGRSQREAQCTLTVEAHSEWIARRHETDALAGIELAVKLRHCTKKRASVTVSRQEALHSFFMLLFMYYGCTRTEALQH